MIAAEAPVRLTAVQQRLASANLGLVHRELARFGPATEDQREHLLGEGLLGLTIAARHFDPSRRLRFSTFAVGVIRNRMVNVLRRAEVRERGRASLPVAGVVDQGEAPDQGDDFIETRASVLKAMGDLPRDVRRATYARVIDGLNLVEIGRRLGVSDATASRLVREGLKALRERLADMVP